MTTLLRTLTHFYRSSIGKKILVALTGVALMFFLIGHLSGNLLIFKGREAINSYAKWLHSLGAGLWVVRLGLLACAVVHIVLTIQLTRENRAARPKAYGVQATRRASVASRTMIWSGLILLCFIVYHLLHFTLGLADGENYYGVAKYRLADGSHDVFGMMVAGFSKPLVSIFYILSMALLCLHLSHGFSSVFQTLGLTTTNSRPLIHKAGIAFAAILFLGFVSIPIAVLCGYGS